MFSPLATLSKDSAIIHVGDSRCGLRSQTLYIIGRNFHFVVVIGIDHSCVRIGVDFAAVDFVIAHGDVFLKIDRELKN